MSTFGMQYRLCISLHKFVSENWIWNEKIDVKLWNGAFHLLLDYIKVRSIVFGSIHDTCVMRTPNQRIKIPGFSIYYAAVHIASHLKRIWFWIWEKNSEALLFSINHRLIRFRGIYFCVVYVASERLNRKCALNPHINEFFSTSTYEFLAFQIMNSMYFMKASCCLCGVCPNG